MTPATWRKLAWTALGVAWKLAPWILCAIVLLAWWLRPAPERASGAAGASVVVAGPEALTPPAKKEWKENPPADCAPGSGDTGERFKVITREPSPEELERLAKQYGFVFASRELGPGLANLPMPDASGRKPDRVVPIARVFGEYSAPRLRYGGTYVPALRVDGELETRFDPRPPPKFALPLVWGLGGFYDGTAGKSDADRHHRLYALLEPVQTKQLYWRIEGGGQQVRDELGGLKWEPYLGLGVEFRSEPSDWFTRRRGLRTVKPGG